MNCPFCGELNIEGADVCQACQGSLEFVSQPSPGTNVERCLLNESVATLMRRKPVIVSPREPIGRVLQSDGRREFRLRDRLRRRQVGRIFSERDALSRLNADAADFVNRPICDVMTRSPEWIEADAEIAFALHKMDIGGYRICRCWQMDASRDSSRSSTSCDISSNIFPRPMPAKR